MVLTLIVSMIGLGFWQLDRLDEKRTINDRIEERADEPAVDVAEVAWSQSPGDIVYRSVVAGGEYLQGGDVRVSNRTFQGAPGDWIMSILELGEGGSVVVNRGFVPRAQVADVEAYAAPTDNVQVQGWLLEGASSGAVGTPEEAFADAPPEVSRPDVGLIAEVAGADDLVSDTIYLQVRPGVGTDEIQSPIPLPLPELSEGTHLAYAVQWFLFTAIAIGGYPLVLRRIARADRTKGDVAFDAGDEPAHPHM